MLTEKEKDGLKSILETLDDDTLISVTFTTTKGLVKAATRHEGLKAILAYSETASSLLRRRKIKKELLLHYLKKNNIFVPVTADKTEFIKACLNLWQSDLTVNIHNGGDIDDVEMDDFEIDYPNIIEPNINSSLTVNISINQGMPSSQNISDLSHELLQEMGKKFVFWFYELLNKSPENFVPQHFWPDCTLLFYIKEGNKVQNKCIISAESVAQYLVHFVRSQNLIFDPNLFNCGTSCSTDIHGLVKVEVSGVIHKEGNCIGLFDEIFNLVHDPNIQDNWKIQHTKLYLNIKQMISIEW